MKNTFTTLLLTLACAGYANAQSIGSYFGIGFGPSIPLGRYAATADPRSSGYATPGAVFSFDYGAFKKNFGFAATLSVADHGVNRDALNREFAKVNRTPSYNDSSTWLSSCLMAGPAYARNVGHFTVEARVLGGFYFAKAPDMGNMGNENRLPEEYWKFNNNFFECVGALGYQLGLGVRYNICDRFYIGVKTNYYHSKPTYKIKYNAETESGVEMREYKFRQASSVMDVTLGFGYRFKVGR